MILERDVYFAEKGNRLKSCSEKCLFVFHIVDANFKTKVFLQVDEGGGIISVQQMRQYVNSDVL